MKKIPFKLVDRDTPLPRFIEIKSGNGLCLKAPIEIWIGGLIQILSPEQRNKLMEAVGRQMGGISIHGG